MTTTEKTVAIARIPAGQPLELSSALFGFFGAALDHCLVSQGDGLGNAAEVIGGEDVTAQQIVAQLKRATTRLRRGKPAKSEPAVSASEPDDEDPLTLNAVRATETGVEFGIGGAAELAREMAANLAAALIPAFEELGAENYLSWDFTDPDTRERYSLIAVKPKGLTPHEARQRAEREAERLRALLAEHGIDPAEGKSDA